MARTHNSVPSLPSVLVITISSWPLEFPSSKHILTSFDVHYTSFQHNLNIIISYQKKKKRKNTLVIDQVKIVRSSPYIYKMW